MSLLTMSISAGNMIIVATIIRVLAINKLPKKTFLVLWGIILVRLLIPFSFPSPLSVYSLVNHTDTSQTGTTAITNILPISPSANVLTESNTEQALWVWGIGAVLCALYFMVAYFKCHREFIKSQFVENDYTIQWLKEHKCKRHIIIRQTSGVSAPLTYGIIHPVILMPMQTDWTDNDRLRYVLAHEYVHIRRFDGAAKLLLITALCIHWFNPLVWVMFILTNRDIELSCDEKVVRLFGENTKSAYALALISMEEKKNHFSTLCNNFSKNAIEERIKAIMKYKKRSVWVIAIAVFLSLSFITTLATSAATIEPILSQENSSTNNIRGDIVKDSNAEVVVYDSAELRYYDNGWPYLHYTITNKTNKNIVKAQYYMLAYDQTGQAVKVHWNFLDSSDEAAYEGLAEVEMKILSGQTYDVNGGWSLYDEEKMDGWPKIGEGGPNKVVYALYCLKQISFEDGSVWNNPTIENWLETYKGKKLNVDDLKNYYPFSQHIESKDIQN